MLGTTISHYRLLGTLGSGGMGVVYRAEDTRLGRQVALKCLPADLVADPPTVERFLREARAAAALSHPNICTIHEVDEADGHHFITMELLEGQTLRERIAAAPSRSKSWSASVSKPPTPLMPRTRKASCIATSSRRIFFSRNGARRRCWTSAWPSWPQQALPRLPALPPAARRWRPFTSPVRAKPSEPSPICHPSRRAARKWTDEATCSRWASCSTKWRPRSCPSPEPPQRVIFDAILNRQPNPP